MEAVPELDTTTGTPTTRAVAVEATTHTESMPPSTLTTSSMSARTALLLHDAAAAGAATMMDEVLGLYNGFATAAPRTSSSSDQELFDDDFVTSGFGLDDLMGFDGVGGIHSFEGGEDRSSSSSGTDRSSRSSSAGDNKMMEEKKWLGDVVTAEAEADPQDWTASGHVWTRWAWPLSSAPLFPDPAGSFGAVVAGHSGMCVYMCVYIDRCMLPMHINYRIGACQRVFV